MSEKTDYSKIKLGFSPIEDLGDGKVEILVGFVYEDKELATTDKVIIDLNRLYKDPLLEEIKRICTEWVKNRK